MKNMIGMVFILGIIGWLGIFQNTFAYSETWFCTVHNKFPATFSSDVTKSRVVFDRCQKACGQAHDTCSNRGEGTADSCKKCDQECNRDLCKQQNIHF